jgi:SAM-dependent methyltransferase
MSSIKRFWDRRAADPALDAAQVTHPDIWQRWLEIETIKRVLPKGGRAIDIGCGAGFATKQIAPLVDEIIGIDFSEGMIERALADRATLPSNASFHTADVLKLSPYHFGTFDRALSIRCLINLPDWATQQRALENIASLVRPGGTFILVEGLDEGRASLNQLRQAVALEPMPVVWHNTDFQRGRTLDFLDSYFRLEREIGFGTYDLVARVVHPLLVAPNPPKYDAFINEIAARVALERPSDLSNSRVAFFCLRRK